MKKQVKLKQIIAATPMGQMPILEFDGKKVIQSVAICRYLAKKLGIAGSNDFEAFEIDSIVDTLNDFRLSESVGILQCDHW